MPATKGERSDSNHRDRWMRTFSDGLRERVPRLTPEQCQLFAEVAWRNLKQLPPSDAAEVFVRSGMTGVTGF
jgi:hypothetical protein